MNSTNPTVQSVVPLAKILVVDDNSLVAKTIGFKLRGSGYQVATALDGAEAMSAVRQDKPDLILLDIMFPNDFASGPWDGFRILEWLHHMDESRKIPIIIITSSEDVKNEERAKAAGAAAFFRKPINHDLLLKAIRVLLGSNVPKPA
jgi:two-component system, OmpR family, response regulator MprA